MQALVHVQWDTTWMLMEAASPVELPAEAVPRTLSMLVSPADRNLPSSTTECATVKEHTTWTEAVTVSLAPIHVPLAHLVSPPLVCPASPTLCSSTVPARATTDTPWTNSETATSLPAATLVSPVPTQPRMDARPARTTLSSQAEAASATPVSTWTPPEPASSAATLVSLAAVTPSTTVSTARPTPSSPPLVNALATPVTPLTRTATVSLSVVPILATLATEACPTIVSLARTTPFCFHRALAFAQAATTKT